MEVLDPRTLALIAKYAYAKGDLLLRRRAKSRFIEPDVFAGAALERSAGDPLKAIQFVNQTLAPSNYRREVLDALRPLVTVYDTTKPLIERAHR